MQALFYLGVFIYLFLSTTTAAAIGIQQVGTASSVILIILFVVKLIENKGQAFLKAGVYREFNVLKVCLSIIVLKVALNDFAGIPQILFFMTVPMLATMLLQIQSVQVKINVRLIILLFFFAECFLSFYERAFTVNVFPYLIEDDFLASNPEKWMFRSSAFLGHPLVNALVVSTILGFILCSKFKPVFKLLSFGTGFLALLCFNARGAILAWCLISLFFLVLTLKENKKNGVALFLIISAVFGILIYLVFNTDLGGRIVNQDKVLDSSAQSRFDVFDAFNYISIWDLLIGNPGNYGKIMNLLNAGGVENSFVVLIINYGLIMFALLAYFLYVLIRNELRQFSIMQRTILLLSFILVGSFNNSLAGSSPWVVFLFSAKVFQPALFRSPRLIRENMGSFKRRSASLY